jgi:hypothetical protein
MLSGNIKMDLREMGWGGMYWIGLIQVRDQWKAFLNTAMNLQVPETASKFLNSRKLEASREGLSSMDLVKGGKTLLAT